MLPFMTDFMSLLASIWWRATRSSDGLRGLVADTLESPDNNTDDCEREDPGNHYGHEFVVNDCYMLCVYFRLI